MTTPRNPPRFSVQSWQDERRVTDSGVRLVICRFIDREKGGHMVRRHVNGNVMLGSPGVAEANPGKDGDGWGPWEPWDPSNFTDQAGLRHWQAIASQPATRADLEAAEPLDLLLLVAALWNAMLTGADAPVVAPWIEGQALTTIRADGARPAWLDEATALDALRRPLRTALVKLGEALGVGELEHDASAWVERGWTAEDGAWWLSSRADAWFRARWGEDAAPAEASRDDWAAFNAGQADAWSLVRSWSDPEQTGPIPSPLVAWLAGELWAREVLPKLEIQRRPVAMPVGVLELVSAPLRATGIDRATDGREWLTRARANAPAELLAVWQHPTVAVQDAGRLLALARDGVRGLVTVNGPRLVYWLAREAWLQIQRGGDAAPLVFEGGAGGNAWATLAREVGAPDDREGARAMGAIVAALGATLLALDTKEGRQEGNLLTYHYRQAGHGRGSVSRLELTPGWPFKLNAAELRGKEAAVSALAPLPPLTGNLPPMPGTLRRNDHAAGARLWLAVLAELARQNQPISAGDGAHLPGSRLAALAVELGVKRPEPLVLGSGVLELWTRDGEHGPALLERVGEDRYHLGPAFPEERRLLEEGGRHREGQAERGEIATRKRAAKAAKAAQHREKRKGNT